MNNSEKMLYLSSKLVVLSIDRKHNKEQIEKISAELASLQRQIESENTDHSPENEAEGFVKFTQKEILQMPTRFRKVFLLGGAVVRAYKRESCVLGNRIVYNYELRCRSDGYNVYASSNDFDEAKRKFLENLKIAERTKDLPKVPTTFHEFSMYYFENFRKRKVSKKTYESDLNRYKNHLQKYFASIRLNQITPRQCQILIDTLICERKERSAQDLYSLLNSIFKNAIAHGIIERNPLSIVLPVTHEREHGKALSKSEEKYLLEQTAGTPYQLMFAVALYTGLRPNEYATVRIEGEFIVAVNSKRKHKKVEYKKIPITPMLHPYIDGVTELKFYIPEVMRDKFKSILPEHKLYDLRTTFYTRCQECGVADVARMEFVGHSLGKLGNTYTDLSDEFLLKEGKKLNY